MLAPSGANGTPLVSIIMATFNCADTLPEALESIAAQTYPNWELVVCDDASTDSTSDVLEEFAKAHGDRVLVLRNTHNSKLSFSLNRCLSTARGELVARMDGDDRCVLDRLERQVDFLTRHPDIDLVGTSMQRFDATGLKEVVFLPPRPDRWSMRGDVPFVHATVMMRQQAYKALGGYTVSPRTVRGQDKDLWFRFFHAGYIGANLTEPLYLVREDFAAIRRRTFRARWNSYRTTLIGYRLLGYPRRWYVTPTLALLKGLIPARGVLLYRDLQARSAPQC